MLLGKNSRKLQSGGERGARPGAIRARRGIQREHKMRDLNKAAWDEAEEE